MGLMDDILKENRHTYRRGELTKADLKSAIQTLYYNRPLSRPTIMLGLISYILFEFASNMTIYPGLKYWVDVPKRVKKRFIYISLFQKHSLYKLKIHIDSHPEFKYELFYGTTSLGLGNSIYCINNLIELKKTHENIS